MKNRAAIDGWTAAHFVTGCIAGRLGLTFPLTMLAGVAYELAEPKFDFEIFGGGFTREDYPPESTPNRAIDLLALAGGWSLTRADFGGKT